jgi:hypothetical protein
VTLRRVGRTTQPTGQGVEFGGQFEALGDASARETGLDSVPPISYDLGLPGWVPTIQLTAYIRRLPAPGPLRVRMHATDVSADRMDETAYAWDSKDRLVAQATQIAAVRIPE